MNWYEDQFPRSFMGRQSQDWSNPGSQEQSWDDLDKGKDVASSVLLLRIIYNSVAQPFYTRCTLNIVEVMAAHQPHFSYCVGGGGGDGLWH
jgi:hypothetical protein